MSSENSLSTNFIQSQLKLALTGKQINVDFPREMLKGKSRLASVLIPLLMRNNEWHILFIRRTLVPNDFHSGQVAFPGGSQDPTDKNAEATAIRETWEEIGVDEKNIRILGHLDRFLTISNYMVTPIVGVLPWPYEFNLSENEVSRIFTIPLSWLADKKNREIRKRNLANKVNLSVTYFKEYDNELLWGASAKIIESFLYILQK